MDPGLCSIPSAASNEQGISTQRAEDQGISTHGADCEGMTTQDAHDPGMTTHTANVQGMTTHKMEVINVTTLSEIQQNITAMTKVMQQMGEAWTSLAGQPSKRHYSDSDTDDDMPSKAKKMTAVPPASSLDDLGDLFESQSGDASGDVDIFDELDDPFSTPEETGPPIHAKLAAKVSDRFLTNLNNEVVTQKIKTYIRPDNCPNLVVPKCNTEVWRNLSKFQRTADLKVSHVQRSISAGAAAIIQILDLLLANTKSPQSLQIPQLVSKGCDALALFGHASQELSYHRRDTLRPAIKREYAGILNKSVPVTAQLFGDDIVKTVKDMKQEASIIKDSNKNQWQPKNDKRRGFVPRKNYWPNKKTWEGKGKQSPYGVDKAKKRT